MIGVLVGFFVVIAQYWRVGILKRKMVYLAHDFHGLKIQERCVQCPGQESLSYSTTWQRSNKGHVHMKNRPFIHGVASFITPTPEGIKSLQKPAFIPSEGSMPMTELLPHTGNQASNTRVCK